MQKLKKIEAVLDEVLFLKSIILLILKDFLQKSSFFKDIMNRSVKINFKFRVRVKF